MEAQCELIAVRGYRLAACGREQVFAVEPASVGREHEHSLRLGAGTGLGDLGGVGNSPSSRRMRGTPRLELVPIARPEGRARRARMLLSDESMMIRMAFALVLAPCLALASCQEPEPTSPVVGLTNAVDPPKFPASIFLEPPDKPLA